MKGLLIYIVVVASFMMGKYYSYWNINRLLHDNKTKEKFKQTIIDELNKKD